MSWQQNYFGVLSHSASAYSKLVTDACTLSMNRHLTMVEGFEHPKDSGNYRMSWLTSWQFLQTVPGWRATFTGAPPWSQAWNGALWWVPGDQAVANGRRSIWAGSCGQTLSTWTMFCRREPICSCFVADLIEAVQVSAVCGKYFVTRLIQVTFCLYNYSKLLLLR